MTDRDSSIYHQISGVPFTDENPYRQLLERITAVTYIDAVDETSSAILYEPSS